MIKSLKTLLAQGYLWRLPLAVVFCYAAIEKIIDPADFARTIHNYRLLPLEAVAPLAITLPWVEIWAGLLVLTRSWGKAAALILAGLLVVFMLAVGFNLARGLDFECGCFGSGGRQAGLNLLWQDGLLLICALMVLKPRLR
ncbi:DoxX family membrane protein [Deltaproteobacteria bacterium OttesenSCG-928-K17]|nr:DoxX family membrane protein [Deltaproteobacteria bacterium OttesenSCG-928-K17]